jgi:branched-chain amino acid transport system ATP-binding protein
VAVLGRNGAGKTTLLKTIVGEITPRGGTIAMDLHDITRLPTERRIRLGLGYVPQEHSVFNQLTVRENLEVAALLNRGRSPIDQVLAWFPELAQRLGQPAGTLSGGERKMLAIGRAVLSRPKLLLLDELTEGVWTGLIDEIAERLRELIKDIAVVIVEQNLEFALSVAEYAYVLDRGRVALEGRSSAVRKDPRLMQLLAP